MRLFFFYFIFVESARQNLSSRDKLTVKYNDVSYGPSSTVEVNLDSVSSPWLTLREIFLRITYDPYLHFHALRNRLQKI